MIEATDSLIDVSFKVCTELWNAKVEAVLCGGSAATYYAPSAYQSSDADFILSWWSDLHVAERVILDMGFYKSGRTLAHANTPITLDFPRGPLAVGEELIVKWNTFDRDGMTLHVIRSEDSVKDRLCAYFYWNDFAGLEQAVAVANAAQVDLEDVRKWAENEGQGEKYQRFAARLRAENRP